MNNNNKPAKPIKSRGIAMDFAPRKKNSSRPMQVPDAALTDAERARREKARREVKRREEIAKQIEAQKEADLIARRRAIAARKDLARRLKVESEENAEALAEREKEFEITKRREEEARKKALIEQRALEERRKEIAERRAKAAREELARRRAMESRMQKTPIRNIHNPRTSTDPLVEEEDEPRHPRFTIHKKPEAPKAPKVREFDEAEPVKRKVAPATPRGLGAEAISTRGAAHASEARPLLRELRRPGSALLKQQEQERERRENEVRRKESERKHPSFDDKKPAEPKKSVSERLGSVKEFESEFETIERGDVEEKREKIVSREEDFEEEKPKKEPFNLRSPFINTTVEKRPLSGGARTMETTEIAASTTYLRPEDEEKSKKKTRARGRYVPYEEPIPHKNLYARAEAREKNIRDVPEVVVGDAPKSSNVSLIIAIVLTIILGAAVGAVAYLALFQ